MSMLRGVDISFDGDANAIKAAGCDFAIAEVVVSGTHESASGARNIAAFKAAGLLAGGYIFAIYARQNPDGSFSPTDPVASAKACAAICNRLEVDIPFALDIEQPRHFPDDYTIPIPGEAIVDWCIQFARTFLAECPAFPVMLFYSFPAYTAQFRAALATRADELEALFVPWHASPSGVPFPAEGSLPFQSNPQKTAFFLERPWGQSWAFWQTQGNARLPGIPHIVDVDVFNGTVDDLTNLGRSTIGALARRTGRAGFVAGAAGVGAAVAATALWLANRYKR